MENQILFLISDNRTKPRSDKHFLQKYLHSSETVKAVPSSLFANFLGASSTSVTRPLNQHKTSSSCTQLVSTARGTKT